MNSASGSRLKVGNGPLVQVTRTVQASNEFELDGQRVVLIDTPGFRRAADLFGSSYEDVTGDIKQFLAGSYVKT